MYFFTADEHYNHNNIIKYCNRPFLTVNEMDSVLIKNFNDIVGKDDITIHAGDFCLNKNPRKVNDLIKSLNGHHIFLKGSHDYWIPRNRSIQIWERSVENKYIVVCHYAMRTWARSHYNSWHLYGHSHGNLEPIGKSWDIGVDNNSFLPISFDQLREIMSKRPNNTNLVERGRR